MVKGDSFVEALARPQPNPGGGAAAAHAATVALALAEKVVRLELQRDGLRPENAAFWQETLEALHTASESLARLVEEDGRAYLRWVAERGSPASEEGRRSALRAVIDTPRVIAQTVCEALRRVGSVCGRARRHLVSDLLVAAELLLAAGKGAFHVGCANLDWVDEGPLRREFREALFMARDALLEAFSEAAAVLESRVAPHRRSEESP